MKRIVVLAMLAGLVVPAVASACPKTTLGDIEDEVMCSICKTPLALAEEAPQAQRERAFIEREIAACRSKDQIKRALVTQFGPAVLALPGDAGDDNGVADKLIYIVPAVGLLLAVAAIGLTANRWRHRRRSATPAAAGDTARVDLDMERYDL